MYSVYSLLRKGKGCGPLWSWAEVSECVFSSLLLAAVALGWCASMSGSLQMTFFWRLSELDSLAVTSEVLELQTTDKREYNTMWGIYLFTEYSVLPSCTVPSVSANLLPPVHFVWGTSVSDMVNKWISDHNNSWWMLCWFIFLFLIHPFILIMTELVHLHLSERLWGSDLLLAPSLHAKRGRGANIPQCQRGSRSFRWRCLCQTQCQPITDKYLYTHYLCSGVVFSASNAGCCSAQS